MDVAYISWNKIYRPLPNVVYVFLAKIHYAHTSFIDTYSDEMWYGVQPKDTKINLNHKYRHVQQDSVKKHITNMEQLVTLLHKQKFIKTN
jgi:hypothetical protein